MMSLFSSFDLFMFNYQKFMLPIIFIPVFTMNFLMSFKNLILKKVFNFYLDFFYSIKSKMSKFFCSMNIMVFFMVFLMNFLSLNSYIFSLTSQLSVTLFWSLMFWSSFNIMMIFRNLKYFLSHFVPSGSPMYLVIFLFLIEMVSNFIRFITLMVRLTANILAGHLLVILLSSIVMKMLLLMPLFLILNMVEMFVSLIQSYIFCTMICLYYSEVD